MRPENVRAAITTLHAYAEAASRGDVFIDGHTVRLDMREIADTLESDTPITAEELISYLGLTKTENGYEWV